MRPVAPCSTLSGNILSTNVTELSLRAGALEQDGGSPAEPLSLVVTLQVTRPFPLSDPMLSSRVISL